MRLLTRSARPGRAAVVLEAGAPGGCAQVLHGRGDRWFLREAGSSRPALLLRDDRAQVCPLGRPASALAIAARCSSAGPAGIRAEVAGRRFDGRVCPPVWLVVVPVEGVAPEDLLRGTLTLCDAGRERRLLLGDLAGVVGTARRSS